LSGIGRDGNNGEPLQTNPLTASPFFYITRGRTMSQRQTADPRNQNNKNKSKHLTPKLRGKPLALSARFCAGLIIDDDVDVATAFHSASDLGLD
jgi:hypothetical protein